jgi:uncharacterized repeat protein (TIGR03803 family)
MEADGMSTRRCGLWTGSFLLLAIAGAAAVVASKAGEATEPATNGIPSWQVVVFSGGPGTGVVTSDPPGLSCSDLCSGYFPENTAVMLTAIPDPGWEVSTWSGDCNGQGPCTLVLDGPKHVAVAYKRPGDAYSVRHQFTTTGRYEGDQAHSPRLVSDGSYLYGSTRNWVASSYGVVYRVALDGSGYRELRELFGGPGEVPSSDGALALNQGVLYWVTGYGGANNKGAVCSVNTDGTGLRLLHSFGGPPGDGEAGVGGLVMSGGSFFGATVLGGALRGGTIFRINPDGSGYQVVYSFPRAPNGNYFTPTGYLVPLAGALYGITLNGDSGQGTVFRVGIDGAGFQVLHTFRAADDGDNPCGSLTAVGSQLHGTTSSGGTTGKGVAFRMSTDGSGYQVLHSFGGNGDGAWPSGPLTLTGDYLYGLTQGTQTDSDRSGTCYRIRPDGSGYEVLHRFAETPPADDWHPSGWLTVAGGSLVGTTESGKIFAMDLTGGGYRVAHSFGSPGDATSPSGPLTPLGGVLYGVFQQGPWIGPLPGALGGIFSVNHDGTGYRVLHTFYTPGDGGTPVAAPIPFAGELYGTTPGGGVPYLYGRFGIVYSLGPGGQVSLSDTVRLGSVGLAGVTMQGLPGNPVTDATGFYSATSTCGPEASSTAARRQASARQAR